MALADTSFQFIEEIDSVLGTRVASEPGTRTVDSGRGTTQEEDDDRELEWDAGSQPCIVHNNITCNCTTPTHQLPLASSLQQHHHLQHQHPQQCQHHHQHPQHQHQHPQQCHHQHLHPQQHHQHPHHQHHPTEQTRKKRKAASSRSGLFKRPYKSCLVIIAIDKIIQLR